MDRLQPSSDQDQVEERFHLDPPTRQSSATAPFLQPRLVLVVRKSSQQSPPELRPSAMEQVAVESFPPDLRTHSSLETDPKLPLSSRNQVTRSFLAEHRILLSLQMDRSLLQRLRVQEGSSFDLQVQSSLGTELEVRSFLLSAYSPWLTIVSS